jgi:subtilase family serine protease
MHASKWSLPALLVTTVLSIPGFSATPDRIAGALNTHQTVTLPGFVQRKAVPKDDLGAASPALRFGSIMLLTSPTAAQQQALAQLLVQQQDRKSPNYHKWLTPEQWADRFGLNPSDIQKITNWLSDQGFTGIQVARGRNWIIFGGTAAQIAQSFGTQIHEYMVNGELHVANATSPKIPAALAGIVTGIRGLDDFHLRPRTRLSVRPDYYSSTLGQTLAPGDIATIYDINPLYNSGIDGTGQKLAIIGQTDIYLNDINYFRSGFSLSTINCGSGVSSTNVITACNDNHFKYVVAAGLSDPGVPLTGGDLSEADLDLEISGSVARGAQLVYVNAPATFSGSSLVSGGVWVSWHWAIDNNVASVMSLSYGSCEFGFPYSLQGSSDETELQKANAEGITFVNSSGDAGAAECDPNPPGQPSTADPNGASATGGYAVSYPASSPEVTGVGGNSISIANLQNSVYFGQSNGTSGGSALSYVPEQAWNDDYEIGQYCQANPTNPFCATGSGAKGWIPITDQKTAQQDMGISSTGGGPSNCALQNATFTDCVSGFTQPLWQTVTISGQPSARFTPDVSFIASPNFPGYIFCTPQSELGDSGGSASSCSPGGPTGISNAIALTPGASVIGGTSAAAPLFAGIVTLLNQSLGSSGLGNVNPTLYQLATGAPNAFHQVTTGTNTVYCTVGTPGSSESSINCPSTGILGFNATSNDASSGYNLVTGLGSVDANNLALAWAASLGGFSLTAAGITPNTIMAGNSVTASISVAPSNGSTFAGTVSFSCANQSGITCSFSPATVTGGSGSTTVTISVAANAGAGATNVTVTGTSGSVSANTTVTFSVTASNMSFTLTSNLGSSGSISVKQGLTAKANLTVNGTNGFVTNGNATTVLPLTYTCSSSPAIPVSTCTFSPVSPNQSATVTVSITTTAPTNAQARPFDRGNRIFYAALFPGLFGIVFVGVSRRRSLRGIRMIGLICVLGASTLWLGSCGGSNNSSTGTPGTPTGNYAVTINATTGGSGQIQNSYQFTLTVTQ